MSTLLYRINHVLLRVVADVPIGTNLDVRFISSLPVLPRSVDKVWVDRKHVQIVLAED